VAVPERPSVRVAGRVTRLASELEARTRTMLVEVDLPNREGAIVPGSFVAVTLDLAAPPALELPVEALVMRGGKPHVAVVGGDQCVRYRAVALAGDDGSTIRVSSGLSEGERVALNVGDTLTEGERVQPVGEPVTGSGATSR
jgi:multidrug efflux pump subunit AcrA (membrane-fusion protein)